MDKSKLMMIVIIALLVLLLGTVIGVGVYLINMSGPDEDGWIERQPPATATLLTPDEMHVVSLGSMTAMLSLGPGGRSDNIIAEVVVGINATIDEVELQEFIETFEERIDIARSTAFEVFLSRTYDQVRTREGRDVTAEMMTLALQEAFQTNLIVEVFFSQWNAVAGSPPR